MRLPVHLLRGVTLLVLLLIPRMALSLPAFQTVSDSDDDAIVTLGVLVQSIFGDAVNRCELRIEVTSDQEPFMSGDSVSVSVFEDDFTNDDLVFSSSFTVTAAEVSAGFVDRTFDCSGMIDDDGGDGSSEVYAEASVDKATCGFFCTDDAPRTGIADVLWLSDDAAEPDDTASQAVGIFPGFASDRISNDGADWIFFGLAEASQVGLTVIHDPAAGRLDALLLDETETEVAVFQREPNATLANEILAAGTYFVVISPDEAGNPNFYDFELEVTAAPALPVLSFWSLSTLLAALMGVAARCFRHHRYSMF